MQHRTNATATAAAAAALAGAVAALKLQGKARTPFCVDSSNSGVTLSGLDRCVSERFISQDLRALQTMCAAARMGDYIQVSLVLARGIWQATVCTFLHRGLLSSNPTYACHIPQFTWLLNCTNSSCQCWCEVWRPCVKVPRL